jgi:hypothetical protein
MLNRLASMLNFAMMQIVNESHLSKTLHWREVRGRPDVKISITTPDIGVRVK